MRECAIRTTLHNTNIMGEQCSYNAHPIRCMADMVTQYLPENITEVLVELMEKVCGVLPDFDIYPGIFGESVLAYSYCYTYDDEVDYVLVGENLSPEIVAHILDGECLENGSVTYKSNTGGDITVYVFDSFPEVYKKLKFNLTSLLFCVVPEYYNAWSLRNKEWRKIHMCLRCPLEYANDFIWRTLKFRDDSLMETDPVSILTYLRLVASYDLTIPKETHFEIFKHKDKLKQVDFKEVLPELTEGILQGCTRFIELLDKYELLKHFFPAVYATKGIDGGHYHNETVYSHLLNALSVLSDIDLPIEVYLAALYHDVGKVKYEILEDGRRRFTNHAVFSSELVERDLRRLKFDLGIICTAKSLCSLHMSYIGGKKSIFKLKNNLDENNIPLKNFFWLKYADSMGNNLRETNFMDFWKLYRQSLKILNEKPNPSIKDLEVNGRDLINIFNMSEGKEIGKVLKILFEKVQTGELINEREGLLKYIPEVLKCP